MLKISIEKSSKGTTVKLEGRLARPWVEELDRAWRTALTAASDGRVAVDLSEVTFICEEGKRLLEQMHAARRETEGLRLRHPKPGGRHRTHRPAVVKLTLTPHASISNGLSAIGS